MIKLHRLSKPNLFLLEQVLALMLFIGVMYISIQVISTSLEVTKQARELSIATERCEDIAELVRQTESISECVDLIGLCFPTVATQEIGQDNEKHMIVFYDDDFNPVTDVGAAYRLVIDISSEKGFGTNINCSVRMESDAGEIFSLDTFHHVGGVVDE